MLTSDLACKTSQVHILHKEKIEYFTLKLIIRGPDFLLRQSLDRLPARVLLLLRRRSSGSSIGSSSGSSSTCAALVSHSCSCLGTPVILRWTRGQAQGVIGDSSSGSRSSRGSSPGLHRVRLESPEGHGLVTNGSLRSPSMLTSEDQ